MVKIMIVALAEHSTGSIGKWITTISRVIQVLAVIGKINNKKDVVRFEVFTA
jgi:hypothetical protein